jgi:hypothetical protein
MSQRKAAPERALVVSGNVITMDPAAPRAGAFGVRAGRIVCVGERGEVKVRPYTWPASEVFPDDSSVGPRISVNSRPSACSSSRPPVCSSSS